LTAIFFLSIFDGYILDLALAVSSNLTQQIVSSLVGVSLSICLCLQVHLHSSPC